MISTAQFMGQDCNKNYYRSVIEQFVLYGIAGQFNI